MIPKAEPTTDMAFEPKQPDLFLRQVTRISDDLHVVRRRLERTEQMLAPEDLDLLRMAVIHIHLHLESYCHEFRTWHRENEAKQAGEEIIEIDEHGVVHATGLQRSTIEQRIGMVRQLMCLDDACDKIVPGDLRILVGEIDRLRAALMMHGHLPGCATMNPRSPEYPAYECDCGFKGLRRRIMQSAAAGQTDAKERPDIDAALDVQRGQ